MEESEISKETLTTMLLGYDLLDDIRTEDIRVDSAHVLCDEAEETDVRFESSVRIEVTRHEVMPQFIKDVCYIFETARCVESYRVIECIYEAEDTHYDFPHINCREAYGGFDYPSVTVSFVYRKCGIRPMLEFVRSICEYATAKYYDAALHQPSVRFERNCDEGHFIDVIKEDTGNFAKRNIESSRNYLVYDIREKAKNILRMFGYEFNSIKTSEKCFMFKWAHDIAKSRDLKKDMFKATVTVVVSKKEEDGESPAHKEDTVVARKELTVYGRTFELMVQRYSLLLMTLNAYQESLHHWTHSIFSPDEYTIQKILINHDFMHAYLENICSKSFDDLVQRELFKELVNEVYRNVGFIIRDVNRLDEIARHVNKMTFGNVGVDNEFLDQFRFNYNIDNLRKMDRMYRSKF